MNRRVDRINWRKPVTNEWATNSVISIDGLSSTDRGLTPKSEQEEDQLLKRPGGELASRPLHFICLCDASGSMRGEKIQALNNAIREAIPHMRTVASENPHADVLVRAIRFADGAQWHVAQPTPVERFQWNDLTAGGSTDMGKAFTLLAEQLRIPPMSERALPPVVVLISDGQPTDDFASGLRKLLELPWGQKSVRLAIAIGDDADVETLRRFIGHEEREPLRASNAEALAAHIKWVSTAVVKSVSSPLSQIGGTPVSANMPLPPAIQVPVKDGVW